MVSAFLFIPVAPNHQTTRQADRRPANPCIKSQSYRCPLVSLTTCRKRRAADSTGRAASKNTLSRSRLFLTAHRTMQGSARLKDERPPILPNVKRAQERASFFAFSFDKIGSTVRRLWRSLRDP